MNKETLQSYNERLNTNNTTLDNVLDLINNLPEVNGTIEITENGTVDVSNYKNANVNVESGGGGETVRHPFYVLKGVIPVTEVTATTTTAQPYYLYPYEGEPNIILVFWYARTKCTVSDNVTVIYESREVVSSLGVHQTLYVGYMPFTPDAQQPTITITQEESKRMGIGYLFLGNCDIPEVVSESEDTVPDGDIILGEDPYFNVYILAEISNSAVASSSKLPRSNNVRLFAYMFNGVGEEDYISVQQHANPKILKVRCPYKKV